MNESWKKVKHVNFFQFFELDNPPTVNKRSNFVAWD